MGLVFDIQRFCTHDGPGIRTVVFLKGCALDCPWCHNPESKSSHPELFYTPSLCIACGKCVEVCPAQAHVIQDGMHGFDRRKCIVCLRCSEACPALALETAGKEMTPEQVMAVVERDRVFYDESGGGITISGGEPTVQFEFTKKLLQAARESKFHTCIETSGVGAGEKYLELLPLVDLFLWDIKDTDPSRHKRNTGADLDQILRNLQSVDEAGGKTVLRCIVLSGINLANEHLDRLIEIKSGLRNCIALELLPYHPLGSSKCERLGLSDRSQRDWEPSDEQMDAARTYLDDRQGS